MSISYKRVLLKLSGEALAGDNGIINYDYIREIGKIVKGAVEEGAQIAIVVGAGNIWRGRQGFVDMDRVRADQMGMLATVINALAIQDAFAAEGCEAVVMTAAEMNAFAEHFTKRDAVKALEAGKVVIFGGGTGSPFFSTDTTAVLRAAEIEADVIMMAKNIDGVYTADPEKDPSAVKYDELSFDKAIEDRLKVMDQTAFALCREGNMPIIVFDMNQKGNLTKLVKGEKVGTLVHV